MPKSQVVDINYGDHCVVDGKAARMIDSLTIPEWVAKEKGLR